MTICVRAHSSSSMVAILEVFLQECYRFVYHYSDEASPSRCILNTRSS